MSPELVVKSPDDDEEVASPGLSQRAQTMVRTSGRRDALPLRAPLADHVQPARLGLNTTLQNRTRADSDVEPQSVIHAPANFKTFVSFASVWLHHIGADMSGRIASPSQPHLQMLSLPRPIRRPSCRRRRPRHICFLTRRCVALMPHSSKLSMLNIHSTAPGIHTPLTRSSRLLGRQIAQHPAHRRGRTLMKRTKGEVGLA